MSNTPPPAAGPTDFVSLKNSDIHVDLSDTDITQSGDSDLYKELNISHLDEPAGSDPDLSAHVDSQANSGNDWLTPPEHSDIVAMIQLPQLQITQQYIELLCSASLDLSSMHADDINDLHNPGKEYMLVDPSPLLCSVCHFINNLTTSWKHYELMQTIEHLHRPDDQLLSFDQVKQHVCWLSGVVPVEHDICVNSCLAYTGPHKTLDTCSHCGES